MKKYPHKDANWTRWFFPFTSYLPSLYRDKFPHRRPGPEKLAQYRRIYNGLTFLYVGIAWTAMFLIGRKYFYKESEIEEDPQKASIAALAKSGWTKDAWKNENRTAKIVTWENGGFVTKDVTKEVRAYALGEAEEPVYDKYKDHDYLAERAQMKKTDPKFDPDYLGSFFEKMDKKRAEGISFFNKS